MKNRLFILFILLFSLSTLFSQTQFQPEDVLQTIGQHQLKFKHILAYIDMEMEGEDPNLLNDQAYVSELTKECMEEFAEEPADFLAEMDQHFEAMGMGAGYIQGQNDAQNSTIPQKETNTENLGQANISTKSQWGQLLRGSVLYYTVTESRGGLFVQTTQYMHLCPNGVAYFYQNSGGGGGAITAPGQLEFMGSSNWKILEEGGQAYMNMTFQGQAGNFPMGIINQKVRIQGLGDFSVQQGGAQCR